MFETGLRQVRLAGSMMLGRRVNPSNLRRLIKDALATLQEFGAPGDDVQELLDGPFADPGIRRALQETALRRTLSRAGRVSPYYRALFAAYQINPKTVTLDTIGAIPLTSKADVMAAGTELVADGAEPVLATRTTGTSGKPLMIWMSRYESELWPALAALGGILRDEIRPDDHMLVNVSSRATAAVQQNIFVCELVGAQCQVLGIIPPEDTLECMVSSPRPTLLSTYPSYLGELIQSAARDRLGPADFALRRIDVGGEVLSTALARAAKAIFGVSVSDAFGMTEVLPVSGRTCSQGHLHHDLNMGLVEVVNLYDSRLAQAGEIGRVVITPYYPFRECMPLVRYDTGDLVRLIADNDLDCELSATPATSAILGKASQLLTVAGRQITRRTLVEALESLPDAPIPARFVASIDDGKLVIALPRAVLEATQIDAVDRLRAEIRVPVRLTPFTESRRPPTLRADLHELTFAREAAA
jgi:phenylacetate-coenzyme A ligase PaaK-like adenylate-forming protein